MLTLFSLPRFVIILAFFIIERLDDFFFFVLVTVQLTRKVR